MKNLHQRQINSLTDENHTNKGDLFLPSQILKGLDFMYHLLSLSAFNSLWFIHSSVPQG